MRAKNVRLYNVLFPVWMLVLLPAVWLAVLPANFLIDSAVLLLACAALRLGRAGAFAVWRRAILRVWLCGFAADIAGGAVLLGNLMAFGGRSWWSSVVVEPSSFNPFENVFSLTYVLAVIALCGGLIYLLDAKLALRRTELDTRQKRAAALCMAVFTAPWVFLIPTAWIY